jgi:hypothetical protein
MNIATDEIVYPVGYTNKYFLRAFKRSIKRG